MNKKYDPKFKREAINLALHSEQTYRQTANDLGLNSICATKPIQFKINWVE